jgi:hypothetical protein
MFDVTISEESVLRELSSYRSEWLEPHPKPPKKSSDRESLDLGF